MVIWITFGFLVGACLGSFAKMLADRSLRGSSFLGRSYCEGCRKTLIWYDLLPVISYLLVRGKCRNCSKKLPISYIFTEVATGVLSAALFYFHPLKNLLNILEIFFYLIFITTLVAVFITDYRKMLIPDRIIFPAIKISLVGWIILTIYKAAYLYNYLSNSEIGKYLLPPNNFFYIHVFGYIQEMLIAWACGLAIGGFFLLLIIITKGKGMGGGDVKLGALMGIVLGYPNSLVAFLLSFISGATFSLLLIALGKKRFKQTIPFGPFLVFGSLVALFWGKQIFNWYLDMSF